MATADRPLTEAGTVLGTFQYMAPEQLEGKEADARTDLFALGTILYEMATGRKAFSGKSQASLVAAILFHALNGLRVIAVDFWSKGPRYQKQMLWSVVGLWLVLMLGAIYPVLGHAARELFGS